MRLARHTGLLHDLYFSKSHTTLLSRRHKAYILKHRRGFLPPDLKDVPGAIGCLYGMLPDVDEYSRFVLPLEVVKEYHRMGFVKIPQLVLDGRQVDVLNDEVQQLENNVEHHPKMEYLYGTSLSNLTEGPLFTSQGVWRACWGLHDLVHLPFLTVAASQALGNAAVRLWYDEVHRKSPRIGPFTPWRQNYALWQQVTTPASGHASLFLAFDYLTKDRGAPCLIPGSHRWREEGEELLQVPFTAEDEMQQMNSIWEHLREEEVEALQDSPPVTLELRRGEALLIHPLTIHAVHGNRSALPCRSATVHYCDTSVRAARSGAVLPNCTQLFHEGEVLTGTHFPIVFDPEVVEDLPLLTSDEAL
ncbi:phytanoyl-CoA dioxygenase family protein [Angomonas deanei]|uniref:Phytanoyl-CoA dioxygenase (PhyH), putative n=1 Tax=Angomonas deanei TaxID=59799 RepID=A0A7G2CJY4_9TRYP|nr:phytanoyl-CoA dioxygenase family protein [Angomonas deanei]CAD2220180.1 Phytanoyl-CoA dioxygenase (PhyH), putative [Angomonas deanei]|eukprot:EPY40681.1 phytanoyl-CoA dioxygenase family protein [Angomonas deanei]